MQRTLRTTHRPKLLQQRSNRPTATARHKISGYHTAAAGDDLLFVLFNRAANLLVFIEFVNVSSAFSVKSGGMII